MLSYCKHNFWRAFVDFHLDNDDKVASRLRNIPVSKLDYKNHTLFMTKTAEKIIPFGAAHTYIAHNYKGVPPLPPGSVPELKK